MSADQFEALNKYLMVPLAEVTVTSKQAVDALKDLADDIAKDVSMLDPRKLKMQLMLAYTVLASKLGRLVPLQTDLGMAHLSALAQKLWDDIPTDQKDALPQLMTGYATQLLNMVDFGSVQEKLRLMQSNLKSQYQVVSVALSPEQRAVVDKYVSPLLDFDVSKFVTADQIMQTLLSVGSVRFDLLPQLEKAKTEIISTMQTALATLSTMEFSSIEPMTVLAFIDTLSKDQKSALVAKIKETMDLFVVNSKEVLQSRDFVLYASTAQNTIKMHLEQVSRILNEEKRLALERYIKPLVEEDVMKLSTRATEMIVEVAKQISEMDPSKIDAEEINRKLNGIIDTVKTASIQALN
jgi:hypothetical protein